MLMAAPVPLIVPVSVPLPRSAALEFARIQLAATTATVMIVTIVLLMLAVMPVPALPVALILLLLPV